MARVVKAAAPPAEWMDEAHGVPSPAGVRVRVDGKLFARGAERLPVRGVTYGPFAPAGDGEPFPAQLARCTATRGPRTG